MSVFMDDLCVVFCYCVEIVCVRDYEIYFCMFVLFCVSVFVVFVVCVLNVEIGLVVGNVEFVDVVVVWLMWW